MDYPTVKKNVFATCRIPDGYFGKTALVGVSMVGNIVVFVADHGYFRSGLPLAQDEKEGLWMLEHHPSAKNVTEVKQINH